VTGITVYLTNGGQIEVAHSNAKTTDPYDDVTTISA
jgi:hypothetical protein